MLDMTCAIRLILKSFYFCFINSLISCIQIIVFHMHQLFHLFLFIIITSLSISIVLIHFSKTLSSFSCFLTSLTFSKKCGNSISFKIINILLVKLAIAAFSISPPSTSILSIFSLGILIRLSSRTH